VPGDKVRAGEIVAQVETAKAVTEIPTSIDGMLHEVLFEPGATVAVNTTIALLQENERT
jgi:pyruvate dehydrogenase E2 component (dihydrolipoamide acetyltransferase)